MSKPIYQSNTIQSWVLMIVPFVVSLVNALGYSITSTEAEPIVAGIAFVVVGAFQVVKRYRKGDLYVKKPK